MNNNQNVGNNQPINQTNTNQFNGQYQNQVTQTNQTQFGGQYQNQNIKFYYSII